MKKYTEAEKERMARYESYCEAVCIIDDKFRITGRGSSVPSSKATEEMWDYLRVGIKDTMFNLEATRRENSYLRKILEEKGK